ncbi:MAG: undecaprenyldiphospho-muramoylpentapeptide beta-N-acetylglucosaminyltransferase, partial [Firmicutes bacterium]|nr:undecaprenyldiphospho-muramoylpentapeptide beta-N-acetylglucosaminyltransferase [Bacillota bacterium]
MRCVVTGGGTGGHIYPALAIARGLKERYGAEVLYVGTVRGLEAELVPRAGLPFAAISAGGLRRRADPGNLLALARTARGFFQAWALLGRWRPAVVVGTGGFVCGPAVLAAVVRGIPTLIHEQNAYPGLTNRLLAGLVRQVALTFPEAAAHLPRRARVAVTGLPVRPEIAEADRGAARRALGIGSESRVLLVFGGSRGARKINEAMVAVLRAFCGRPGVHVIHATGKTEYRDYAARLEASGIKIASCGNITLTPYLYDMAAALAAADLVVCRAGASTIAELTVRGLPAVLVPYPHAAARHQ